MSDDLSKSSEEIEEEIDTLVTCIAALVREQKQLKIREKEIQGLLDKHRGSQWGSYGTYGTLQDLKRKLADAKRTEADADAIPVVWEKEPSFGKDEYVVRKITKKRIYIAKHGSPSQSYYNKDGTSNYSTNGTIDLEGTFGKDYSEILS